MNLNYLRSNLKSVFLTNFDPQIILFTQLFIKKNSCPPPNTVHPSFYTMNKRTSSFIVNLAIQAHL